MSSEKEKRQSAATVSLPSVCKILQCNTEMKWVFAAESVQALGQCNSKSPFAQNLDPGRVTDSIFGGQTLSTPASADLAIGLGL